jgi:hypothetical protein
VQLKKLFSQFNNIFLKNKAGLSFKLWLAFHLSIPLLLGISLFFAPNLDVSVQILDLLPQKDRSKIAEADNVLAERNGRESVVLFASPNFETAKKAAIDFYNEFKNEADVENATLFFDSGAMEEFADFFHKYRFVIAGKNTFELLESCNADVIAMDALASAYGAFNYIPLHNIDKDPFLLAERQMKTFLSSSMLASGNVGIKEDVLAVQYDGIWHVVLRMTFSPAAISVTNTKNSIIGDVYTARELIKETEPELEIYFSGMPFHGFLSA